MSDNEVPFNNDLFSNHFLSDRIKELQEWKETEIEHEYEAFVNLYKKRRNLLNNDLKEGRTWSNFTGEFFTKILGHFDPQTEPSDYVSGTEYNPDYTLFRNREEFEEAQSNDNEFDVCYAIVENKRWGRTLDKSKQNHDNPAFQIFNYVDRLRVPWGILTNGKKWRLYSYQDLDADTYFEIDIEKHIIEPDREEALENFKYFYLFFRKEAFLPKQDAFLDKVLENSIRFAQKLEEDLEDKIYTALEVTARGFFDTNDLERTEENRKKVHEASLIFLYRILFVLNAESRGLLPIDDKAYRQAFGLIGLKEMLEDDPEDNHLFQENTIAWDNRLSRLFEGIDEGYELDEERIPAYNGGLFDEEEQPFLAENKLQGNYLQRILELLAQSENEEGEKVLVDYQDLNIRHLGSVYEGLLEHKLEYAPQKLVLENGEWKPEEEASISFIQANEGERVDEGEVFITNESGERKATGSYYTPEYIVEYIVEKTIGPKVDEKVAEVDEKEILEEVLDLNICDPAMGSGHFLTEATSYIARRIMEEGNLEDKEIDEDNEFVWVKRQVVQNCIYGVDINPLATELAKLSLWIETMAEGKPLSFLDHHLKIGNSLIGSEFDEIFSHPTEEQKKIDNERFKFGSPEDLKEQFQDKYREIEGLPEETKEQVNKKEEKYEEFRDSTLYNQIRQLANIHTRQFFEEEADSSDYESFLVNIGAESTAVESLDWHQNAQEDSQKRNYFHWEIEFPKVFFNGSGGFDAIVGNPPYFNLESIDDEGYKDYLEEKYSDIHSGKADILFFFFAKAIETTNDEGKIGYIVARYFTEAYNGKKLRDYITSSSYISEIVDFGNNQIFPGVDTLTSIIELQKESIEETDIVQISDELDSDAEKIKTVLSKLTQGENTEKGSRYSVSEDSFGKSRWMVLPQDVREVKEKINDQGKRLGDFCRTGQGMMTGLNEAFTVSPKEIQEWNIEEEVLQPLVKNGDLRKFLYRGNENKVIYLEDKDIEDYPNAKEYLSQYKDDLEDRAKSSVKWYRYLNPINKDIFENYDEKIICPFIATDNRFYLDRRGLYNDGGDIEVIVQEDSELSNPYLVALLNSRVLQFYHLNHAKLKRDGYYEYFGNSLQDIPIQEGEEDTRQRLTELSEEITQLKTKKNHINTDILDYLGNYNEGVALKQYSGYQPPSTVSELPINDTTSEKEKLQVGSVQVTSDQIKTVIKISARFKPENEELYETDQYGYAETELYPAMEFHDLSEMEAALIEEFVPVAVEEAGGFANFRKKATKTKSLIDRLKELTLPKLDDVEEDLRKFVEQKKKAEELEQEIQETDDEINQIVYDLYDLSDEEIKVIEEAVGE